MHQLAPLTFHAVQLSDSFPDMESALASFCAGGPGLDAREQLALFSCVASMFAHWGKYRHIRLGTYATGPESAARLAFACLFVLRRTLDMMACEELKRVFSWLNGLAHEGSVCPLTCTPAGEIMPGSLDPDAAHCNIVNNSVCLADAIKIVEWPDCL